MSRSALPAIFAAAPVDGWPPRVVVCQLSRGVAPAQAVAEAVYHSRRPGVAYMLIAGRPLVEAKNYAADYARHLDADLVIVEDDILAPDEVWDRILEQSDTVRTVQTRCRNGEPSTKFDAAGEVFYSGTAMVAIPATVLARFDTPVFVANRYGIANGELFLRGPSDDGKGSDTHLWATIRALDPRPGLECVGDVAHLMHPLNRDRHELQTPCGIVEA